MRIDDVGDHMRTVSPGGRSSETVGTAGVTKTFQFSLEVLGGMLML
jgi:hypothetical protein